MVLDSFVSGNLDTIKDFINHQYLKVLKLQLMKEIKENESLLIDLKSIKKNKIIKSTITKSSIKINVRYESFQIRALMDKNEKIIDGDNKKKFLLKMNGSTKEKLKMKTQIGH